MLFWKKHSEHQIQSPNNLTIYRYNDSLHLDLTNIHLRHCIHFEIHSVTIWLQGLFDRNYIRDHPKYPHNGILARHSPSPLSVSFRLVQISYLPLYTLLLQPPLVEPDVLLPNIPLFLRLQMNLL